MFSPDSIVLYSGITRFRSMMMKLCGKCIAPPLLQSRIFANYRMNKVLEIDTQVSGPRLYKVPPISNTAFKTGRP